MNLTEMVLILTLMLFAMVFYRLPWKRGNNATKTNAERLARIRNASFWIQIMIGLSMALGLYEVLAHLCGWPVFGDHSARLFVSQGHTYTSLAEVPGELLGWVLIKTGLGFAALMVLFLLFGLYRRGILFSARNVLYIRFQGYYLILDFIADYMLQSKLHDMALSTNSLMVGLLIIFISWIMDEGRKIQEEQALTV